MHRGASISLLVSLIARLAFAGDKADLMRRMGFANREIQAATKEPANALTRIGTSPQPSTSPQPASDAAFSSELDANVQEYTALMAAFERASALALPDIETCRALILQAKHYTLSSALLYQNWGSDATRGDIAKTFSDNAQEVEGDVIGWSNAVEMQRQAMDALGAFEREHAHGTQAEKQAREDWCVEHPVEWAQQDKAAAQAELTRRAAQARAEEELTAITRPMPQGVPSASVEQQQRIRIGAICNDGTESYATGSGACSHHGGVNCWKYSDGTCTKP